MTEVDNTKELSKLFGSFITKQPDLIGECLSILRLYALPPDELYYKWEAFSMSHLSSKGNSSPAFNLENARQLKTHIQQEAQKAAQGKVGGGVGGRGSHASANNGVGARNGGDLTPLASARGQQGKRSDFFDGLGGSSPSTPAFKKPYLPTPTTLARTPPTISNNATTPVPSRVSAVVHSSPSGPSLQQPLSSPHAPSSSIMIGPNKYTGRTNALEVLETFHPQIPGANGGIEPLKEKSRIKMTASSNPKDYAYRYMFEKISERSEVLDDRIDEFAAQMKTYYSIPDFEVPTEFSEELVYVVGRIVSDTSDSKLNEPSIQLESSRNLGGGSRVPLKFTPTLTIRDGPEGVGKTVPSIELYPGFLVALKGVNSSGSWFQVSEILLPPSLDSPQNPPSDLLEFQHGSSKLGGKPLSLISAAGPFTLDGDLEYDVFGDFMDVAEKERPDVLLLFGPFIPSNHPLIASGASDLTPAEIFRTKISSRLARLLATSPATNILLIPSVRDMVGTHMAFPQGGLERDPALGIPRKVKMLPNPCIFQINEIVIGVTSVDSLFHMKRESFVKKSGTDSGGSDVMTSLCKNFMGQRTFYPLFPPPPDLSQSVNLDLTHNHLLQLPFAPDLLILPSDLGRFVKQVDSTIAINPRRLTQHQSGGSFARVVIHPMRQDDLVRAAAERGGEMVSSNVPGRIRVEIVRI